MRFPCPLGADECPNVLTVILAGRYLKATTADPAEESDLIVMGCPHVDNASGWEWNRPGGIADTLYEMIDAMDLDLWDAEIDRRLHLAREEG